MGKVDLHIHTTASDGSCKPEEIVEFAKSKSLSVISITDHDTILGYLAAIPAAEHNSITLIPGTEITAVCEGKEIHVLAYNFDSDDLEFRKFLNKQQQARVNRMEQILCVLRNDNGIHITLDEVKAQAKSNNVGRPHVAKILVKRRVVASVAEAFIRYLGSQLLEKLDVGYTRLAEVTQVVAEAGGASVLAHPGSLYNNKEVEKYLDAGLDGIECIHPAHGFDYQKNYTDLAEKRNLLITGGSDFHGTGREYDPYFGIVTVSEKKASNLIRMTENRKKLKLGLET